MVLSYYLQNALLITEKGDWGNSKSQTKISLINKIRHESKVNKLSLGESCFELRGLRQLDEPIVCSMLNLWISHTRDQWQR